MTSRARLLNAIRCRPVDRVPINTYELCARNSQSFENNQPSYQGLMQFIREHTDAVARWNPAGNGVFALSAHPTEITYTRETEAARGLTVTPAVVVATALPVPA